MRLGVNALRLSGQRLGVGRYIEYMLGYWDSMLARGDRVVVYVREPVSIAHLGLSAAFEFKVLASSAKGVFWENFVLPRHSRETDVLFCPSYTVPLAYRGRTVVATHSVNEAQGGTHSWWYSLTYSQRYRLSARKADAVVVPSGSTRRHVHDLYGVSEDKIAVIPQGVDDSFRPLEDEALLRETRKRYLGEDCPYILFVGKLSQRRNIPALIEAFGIVKRRERIPHRLLLFGPNVSGIPLETLAAEHGVRDSVVQTDGKLDSHRDIIPVYSAADVFVHPSAYEGFSLTIVEAMACGRPVVTVNRGAAKEIVDSAALTVEEPSVSELAAALGRVLTDSDLKRSLGAKALARAKSFRYEDTARHTLKILRRVAENG